MTALRTLPIALFATAAAPAPATPPIWVPMTEQLRTDGTIYESVCHLDVKRSYALGIVSKNWSSTAALYRGRYLITAAHNVASDLWSRVSRINVSCGTARFTEAAIDAQGLRRDAIWVARGYSLRRGMPERHCTDYAVVRLPEPITATYRFELGTFREGDDAQVTVAGYPGAYDGDYPGDAANMDGDHLFSGSASARASRLGYLIDYGVLTNTGVSGGPVWVMRGGTPTLVGVHVGGTDATARARMISDPVRQDIEAAIDAWERGVPTRDLPHASWRDIGCG
jgi:hypothetical protein